MDSMSSREITVPMGTRIEVAPGVWITPMGAGEASHLQIERMPQVSALDPLPPLIGKYCTDG